MRYLYVCNTSSDSVSKINIEHLDEQNKIVLGDNRLTRVGPHGICIYKNNILTANNYSNDISVIDIKHQKKVQDYFIGMHCNDVRVQEDTAYVICGDSNNVITFNLKKEKIMQEIPCGNLPHSIDIDKRKKIAIISNMEDDSITLMDCSNNSIMRKIKVGAYPTKALFSLNGDYIFVCESNIGLDCKGSLAIISLKNFEILTRVRLGNSPVDMYCDERFCYVSNFGEGTISIIDINNFKEVKAIRIGGMPRGIIRVGRMLYVGDNYNNLLFRIDIKNRNKKAISIGGEPTGMTLN
ncbi:YncE family protein [Haloimpatiens sp. FM7330]|uniref:YncE family protein n=1 Tax=Haloimpatiens sp. FM7330 TaxID=3298610 RepID=UPI0036347ED6